MTGALLAIDPGTYQTGIALFEDGKLVDWKVITVNRGVEIEDRINNIVEWLEVYVQRQGVDIRQVAIEKPMGIDAHRPAPELQVLVRRLRRWARTKPHKWGWTEYHPSTVLASVRIRGMAGDTKSLIRVGVMALYPQVHLGLDQDVYDAIAIGHCRLAKTREAELIGGENNV